MHSVPWIFLSKRGDDDYINRLARGAGQMPTDPANWNYESSNDPIVLRGIMKHNLMKRCWQDGRNFAYVDTGYFGNRPTKSNPQGWKFWHRIVWNNLQHTKLIDRPADRWERLGIKMQPRRRQGRKILITAPDEKPCIFYGIELQQWIDSTVATLKQLTDRPIELRQRAKNVVKLNRGSENSFEAALDDAFAVVSFNSVAAVESVMMGVPVFVLAPASAALPVANTDLTKINDPWYPDDDLREVWARHLAYGQFHVKEMESGQAHRILEETLIKYP